MVRYRKHWYCRLCAGDVKALVQERKGLSKWKNNSLSPLLDSPLERANILSILANLEENIGIMQQIISTNPSQSLQKDVEITTALKNIANNLENIPTARSPPDRLQEGFTSTSEVSPSRSFLNAPEFRVPLEGEVRRCIRTAAILDWGAVLDVAIKYGWHRSYHTFLAFLRRVDRLYPQILIKEYKGKRKTTPFEVKGHSGTLYTGWVAAVSRHLSLMQNRGLVWQDFSVPRGSGGPRNTQAKWQQAVIDFFIERQNAPASSREIADALLPQYFSSTIETTKRRMLQNVVARLTRRGAIALVNPAEYPKKYWIPNTLKLN